MTILFAYDGSESAGAAIAAAGKLFEHDRPEAVVLSVWEPLTVEALRAVQFGGWLPLPLDVNEVDERSEAQAQLLAEHGARLAAEAGFEARALWIADELRIANTIVERAVELDADLIVMGRPRPDRHRGLLRQRLEPRPPARFPARSGRASTESR